MSGSCLLLATILAAVALVLGFLAGRWWADQVTLPAYFPTWLRELLNWKRG